MKFKKALIAAVVLIAITAQIAGCTKSDEQESNNFSTSTTTSSSSSSSSSNSSSSSSSDGASEPGENSDTETTNEALRERAKAEYAKVKDKVTCDENTYVDRFVEYVEYGMDEEQAAFEVYLEFAKEQPNVTEVTVEKPTEQNPSQSTQTPSQSTQTPSQSTQTPSQSTQTPSQSTQTPSQSTPTQSGEVNVKGEPSRNGHYVDKPGGRYWKDGGNYYRSKEAWLNGEEPVSMLEVDGVTMDDLGHIDFGF